MKRRRLMFDLKDELGAAYIEYVIIAAVAVLLLLGTIQLFFGGIRQILERLIEALKSLV